jgi:hypothetical protein
MDRSPLVSKVVGALADAVEALARHSDATWTLSFEVPGHTVTVADERVVLVDGARAEPAWP